MNKSEKSNIIADRYEIIAACGEGAYGKVYHAKDLTKKTEVALKKVKIGSVEEGVPISSIREIGLQKELIHDNVVRLNDVIHLGNKILLVFEYVHSDLKKKLKENGNNPLPSKLVQSYLYQLLKGVQYVHKFKVLHRDLKTENLLISDNDILKIADFGLARSYGLTISQFRNDVVSLWYRAPDVLLGNENYSTSIDMWSVGCIFAEMSNGNVFFKSYSDKDQIKKIFSMMGTPNIKEMTTYASLNGYKEGEPWEEITPTPLKELCPNLDDDGLDLLGKLLELEPEKRISATDALKHPYFKDIDEKAIYKK